MLNGGTSLRPKDLAPGAPTPGAFLCGRVYLRRARQGVQPIYAALIVDQYTAAEPHGRDVARIDLVVHLIAAEA